MVAPLLGGCVHSVGDEGLEVLEHREVRLNQKHP